jgi:hypothetical protein
MVGAKVLFYYSWPIPYLSVAMNEDQGLDGDLEPRAYCSLSRGEVRT